MSNKKCKLVITGDQTSENIIDRIVMKGPFSLLNEISQELNKNIKRKINDYYSVWEEDQDASEFFNEEMKVLFEKSKKQVNIKGKAYEVDMTDKELDVLNKWEEIQ